MNNSGDAAEQVVRLSLEGTEVALKLTGSAAKNVAADVDEPWGKESAKGTDNTLYLYGNAGGFGCCFDGGLPDLENPFFICVRRKR